MRFAPPATTPPRAATVPRELGPGAAATVIAPEVAPGSMTGVPPTGEARLDAVVARVLQADDVPAFSKVMQELMTAIGRDDSSAQRLANVVLRDYALTVKVLRAANTVHFNRGGRPVQSATHALMLLGARTVRDLASALLLFDHYRQQSPGLKELLLLSLLTASTARAVAERCGAGVDAEAAHLAGMFRNLGEVLAAAHLRDEYVSALCAMEPGTDATAAGAARRGRSAPAVAGSGAPGAAGPGGRAVGVQPPVARTAAVRPAVARTAAARAALGCSFEELGAAVARHWGMPDLVRHGMHADGAAGEELGALCTAFAHEFTVAVHRGEAVAAPQEVARLLQVYGDRLQLTREVLQTLAQRAVDETREVFGAAGVRLDDLRLARQIAAAALGAQASDAPEAPVAEGVDPTAAPDAAPPTVYAAIAPPSLAEVRAHLDAELAAVAAQVTAFDVSRVLLLALEAVLRGGPFDRTCFHAAEASARAFRPRMWLGQDAETVLATVSVPFDAERDGVGPALRRGEEVHLASGAGASPAAARLLRGWQASSAVLFPVRVGGAVIGCLYADHRRRDPAPDPGAVRHARAVARTLEGALDARRGGPPVASRAPEHVPTPMAALAMSVKMDAVLRVLRGEPLETVAAAVGVPADALATWRAEFLAGAAARLATP